MLATLSLNGLVNGLSPLLAYQSFEVGKYNLMLSLCLAKLSGSACKKNSSAHIDFFVCSKLYICLQLESFSRTLGRNGLKQCVFCHHPKCCCAFEIWIIAEAKMACVLILNEYLPEGIFCLTSNWAVCCVHLFFFQFVCPAQIGFWCVCSLCWLCASKCSHIWLFEAGSLAVVCVCSYC